MPITTNLDKFRLELGDVDETDPLLNDDEANYFLAKYDPVNILSSVADACEALAARFARQMDFSEDGQSFRASQQYAQFKAQAAECRRRAHRSGSVQVLSLVTPYSEGDDVVV